MITRAVQDENLVGDQQWWVTKPYEWGRLLGAKLLFLAAFIFVPVFVLECVLLVWAGFHPTAVLPALGLHLASLGLVIVLPLLAIGTVTATIARSTLTILGLLVVLVGALVGLSYTTQNGAFGVPDSGETVVLLFFAVVGAAVVLQFARRLLWRARLMMIAAIVLLLLAVFLPTSSGTVAAAYRPASGPLHFAYNTGSQSRVTSSSPGNLVAISVPVTVSGIAPQTGLAIEGAQATIESPDYKRWTTDWQSQYGGVYLVDTDPDSSRNVYIRLKRSFARGEAGKRLTLHLRLAVAQLSAGEAVRAAIPDHEFAVPGFGICALAQNATGQYSNPLNCRSAVREPVQTLVRVQWSDVPCSTRRGDDAWVRGEGWAGSLGAGNEFGLNPVVQVGFFLSNNYKKDGDKIGGPRFLCPGTPITFTPYRVVRRAEYDATFVNFIMPKEEEQPQGGYSVGVRVGD